MDGSYSPKSNDESLAGWGVLFEHGDSYSGTIEHKGTRQIAGECEAVLEAVRTILDERDGEKLIIFYDYQGLPEWANGTWKAKNEITKKYQEEVQEAMKYVEIKFIKIDAAANKADALATAAIGIQSVH